MTIESSSDVASANDREGRTRAKWRAGGKLSRAWVLRILIGAVLVALPAIITDAYYLDLVVKVYIWWAAAAAWNIVGGYAGQFSIGHGGFFAIGAYATVLLSLELGVTPWIGLWIGALTAAVIALGLGFITLRLNGPFFALLTLAFGEIVYIMATVWRDLTQGSDGLLVPTEANLSAMVFPNARGYGYVALGLAMAIYLGSLKLQNSRHGYQFHALRENEDAARAVGVQARRLRVASFAVSAALTAMAGGIFAQYLGYIDPSSVASVDISIKIALIGVVGGIAVASGPFVGAVLIVLMTTFLRDNVSAYVENGYLGLYGLFLIIVVLAAPGGLVSLPPRFARWSQRKGSNA